MVQMHVMTKKCQEFLKQRLGAEASGEYGKLMWRHRRLSEEGQSRCRPMVDSCRKPLSIEYLRLAEFFAGKKKCAKARARAVDAANFGASDAELTASLGNCGPLERKK